MHLSCIACALHVYTHRRGVSQGPSRFGRGPATAFGRPVAQGVPTAIGRPGAVRAAGTACGDNALAVLIPCHRVLRSDGTAGGYAWGVARKQALLAREKRKK